MKDSQHDLVIKVKQVISQESHTHAARFESQFKSSEKSESGVISDLNRYFNMELSVLKVDTLDARECLIDGISASRWLSYFVSHVLPLLIRFQ